MGLLEFIKNSLVNLDAGLTLKYVSDSLKCNVSIMDIINSLADGMKLIGKKYEENEYFIADLIAAVEIFNESMDILKPKILERREAKPLGKVVIGTVEGDIHDVGKNLVRILLEANGFEVVDLGVDASSEKFVDAVKEYKPDIVGISTLLTSTMMNMRNIVEVLEREGLRDDVKIVIGGAPVTQQFAESIGADAYGENAFKAVEICKNLVKK
jgi:corrinoid protein of di/trimethylamine methyltransferase